MSKTFCIRPWIHTTITSHRTLKLCCESIEDQQYSLDNMTLEEWWTSDLYTRVRKQMLNGEEPKECKTCFYHERIGAYSLRQKSNAENKIIEKYAEKSMDYLGYPKLTPITYDLSMTNLCNLKCLMCNEYDSSSIFVENKQLKINIRKTNDEGISDGNVELLKELFKTKLKLITLIGGETLMVPKLKEALLWAINNKLIDNTVIQFSTNGTKFDDEWMDIIAQVPHPRIAYSADAVGKLNDYIRYGSNWEQLQEPAKKLSALKNVNFLIHATIQNLNLLHIGDLLLWCKENNYYFDYQVLVKPSFLSIRNMPTELLLLAKDRLNAIDHPKAKELIDVVSSTQSDTSQWEEFVKEINLRDSYRKNSLLELVPEFKDYWNAAPTK